MNNIKSIFNFLINLVKREINYILVTPTHALLFITYRCTNQCRMCTIWKRGKKSNKREELNLEYWKKCVDELLSRKIKVIEIFGGDSLIRKDVTIPLIEYIKKKNENVIVDFPTNCNLLDEETAKALIRAGVDRLYVSLDGTVEIHDKIRGRKGAYNSVLRSLEYLVEAKKNLKQETPEIIINCTISALNIDSFEQIIPVVEKFGADTIEFEYVGEFKEENIQNTNVDGIKPNPFYITLDSSNLLTREQAYLLKKKMKNIRELAKKLRIKIVTQHIDALTIDNLTKGMIPNKKCYFCRYTVSIDPFGNVMGCFHFNNYILGNIKYVPFSLIWKNKNHRRFLKFQKKGKIKICNNCISGVHRNPTLLQSFYRATYFILKGKGFDER